MKKDNEVIQLPVQTRAAPISVVSEQDRTVNLVWSTGAAVKRYDYYNDRYYLEELSMEPSAIVMDRLLSGAPLLKSHDAYDLNSVLGVVESASVADGEGTATVRFSERADVEPFYQDVKSKIIRNVSVGYKIHEIERIAPVGENAMWVYRAIRWEPMEISLVSVPADPGAGIRSDNHSQTNLQTFDCIVSKRSVAAELQPQGAPMKDQNNPSAAAPNPAEDAIRSATEAAATKAREEERKRSSEILDIAKKAGLDDVFARGLIDTGVSIDMARAKVIDEIAERAAKNPVRGTGLVSTITDETETRREAMSEAILHRMNPVGQLHEAAREYRHMSLIRMCEEVLTRSGVRGVNGLPAREIVARAMHVTGDFPAILANVMNKRLRNGYNDNVPSYTRWARRAPNAPDFKNMTVAQLSATPDLLPMGEAGELKYGSMSDGKETYAVATFARGLNISRQTIINDDLRAFDRVVSGFASSARRLENRLVYQQLTANPLMGDGLALFEADKHKNLIGTGTAISIASLTTARALMRKQKGMQNEELNIAPAFLLVPSDQEQLAYQYTSTQFVPAKSGDVNEFRAGGRTSLEPIVDAVLDGSSTTAWYLVANNSDVDTVEFCYLDGSEGVYIETDMDFDVDGMKVKARLDFATKVIDYRGLVKNNGA